MGQLRIDGKARPAALLCACALLALAVLALPASASAEPPAFWKSCDTGLGAGQCSPGPIGVDPRTPGHLFVADSGRIAELTAWGGFVRAWGWGAIDGAEELQVCDAETGCQKGLSGLGTGQLAGSQGVAVDSAGAVHVVDLGNRIQKFSPTGEFVAAYGGDVVAHGPSDSANDETQELSIAASEGTFKLSFTNPFSEGGKAQTAALPHNASAAELEAALNALSTIGGVGGSVSVTGGPGDATGSSPYEVTFEGNLGGDDVPLLDLDRSELGAASIGGTLRCYSDAFSENGADPSVEFSWLRNGVPIAGEESPSYTTVAADEGKAIQCRVRTEVVGGGGAIQAATPVYVAPPEPATAPPVAGEVTLSGAGIMKVGGPGGQTLTCNPGKWEGAESFAYEWYRNGTQIAAAEASTYVVSTADLASPAFFQCAAIGANAGGATAKLSLDGLTGPPYGGTGMTNPIPANPVYDLNPRQRMEPPSNVHTTNPGGEAEICSAAAGDVCKAGVEGDRPGFFGDGRSIAIDREGTLETATDDVVYVGDADRIQEFGADGEYLGEVELPEAGKVASLAVDQASGDLYFAYESPIVTDSEAEQLRSAERPDVHRLDPGTGKEVGKPLEVDIPGGIATDAEGDVYVVNLQASDSSSQMGPGEHSTRILVFDSAGDPLEAIAEVGFNQSGSNLPQEFDSAEGIATGQACLSAGADLYLTGSVAVPGSPSNHFVRAWGPPPDDPACPPTRTAPEIEASYATSVSTTEAALEGLVNPHFWSGAQGATRYYVQYATAACVEAEGWEAECVSEHPAPPGSALKGGVVDEALPAPAFLTGLQPATSYRFRFAAESIDREGEPTVEGQPVIGTGGAPGEAGAEGSFRTYATPAGPNLACPNKALRTGPAANLPDCRAYEMVSPVDKANGEILTKLFTGLTGDLARHIQAAPSGGALTYSSYRAFADPEGAPYVSQYIARREAGGWSTENVSTRQEGDELGLGLQAIGTLYRYFSPDLAEGWLQTASDPVLAPGGQKGYVNVYRRDNASGDLEACTTAPPPLTDYHSYLTVPQGVSAGGEVAVFRANDKLTPDASSETEPAFNGGEEGIEQLYACPRAAGSGPRELRLASVLPAGVASEQPSTGGASGYQDRYGRSATLAGALSEDGSRLYWQTGGRLYLRENPAEPQSEQANGSAQGQGDLVGPALGVGDTVKGFKNIGGFKVKAGAFAVGQEVSGPCLEEGTKVTAVELEADRLKVDKGPTAKCEETEIVGHASTEVSNVSASFGAFAPGQAIAGAGIPPGTSVEAVDTEAGTLTLSTPATKSGAEVALEAFSECTEPDRGCTVSVSPGAGASFRAASPDGAAALFTQGGSLYRFEAASGEAAPIAADVVGLAGWGADLSRVYLASTSAEPGGGPVGPNPEGDLPVKGALNLYLYEEGGGFAFLGALAAGEVEGGGLGGGLLSPIAREPNSRTARATPDGARLAFTTAAPLTGYDNLDRVGGEPAAEVYLYDAEADELHCASCNPSGARPLAREVKRSIFAGNDDPILAAALVPPWINSFHAPRALADDGNRLFFNSHDALALTDTNGAQDVYQWEAPGTGDCTEATDTYSAQNGGCVELISSGKSAEDSEFFDADPTGADVFFSTARSLVSQDPGLVDVYDARIEGGFPVPAVKPGCEGEACQGPASPPEDPTPASSTFQGAGNVAPEPAAKKKKSKAKPKKRRCGPRKARRGGRCVVKKRHHGRAGRSGRAGR